MTTNQVLRFFQFELSRHGPHEKAGHDRLANVHRIEHAAEARIRYSVSSLQAHDRLVAPYQLASRVGVASTDASDDFRERRFLGHRRWVRVKAASPVYTSGGTSRLTPLYTWQWSQIQLNLLLDPSLGPCQAIVSPPLGGGVAKSGYIVHCGYSRTGDIFRVEKCVSR